MRVLLLQLDGKLPNLALMRISAHHRARGDDVTLRQCKNPKAMTALGVRFTGRDSFLDKFDKVYASLIFTKSRPIVTELLLARPDAVIGGTGYNLVATLQAVGILTTALDYSIYPLFTQSLGFTQRGCTLSCEFCVVPTKEGKARPEATIAEIYRGEPHPRELLLLDNDFFARANPWRDRIAEIIDGDFKVSFNQGINARFLNDESAAAIASVKYYDDSMTVRRIYTAWDNRKDERTLFRGLEALTRHGVKPDHIMVYMLIGYWEGETVDDWLYRQKKLREFGCRPYPMPYVRNQLTLGFQRWCIGAYDKTIPWREWLNARCQPVNLNRYNRNGSLFD
jgi:hypothetical protein